MKIEMNEYNNYFKVHYNITFSEDDILNYSKWFNSQFNFIKRYIKDIDNATILEIWSWFWWFYKFIENKWDYTWLEIDRDVCQFSNNRFWNKFLNVSIEDFQTKKKYDYIFAFEVLEHLNDPIWVIKKINNLLKDWWIFIWTSPYPFKKNILADDTHLFVLHPLNWKRLFIKNWFNEVKTYPMSFLPFLRRINKYFNLILNTYIPINWFISTTLIFSKKW